MTPSAVARSALLAASAKPFFLRLSLALSRSPLLSSRAFLHSSIPAPVSSRSCLTSFALIAICVVPGLPGLGGRAGLGHCLSVGSCLDGRFSCGFGFGFLFAPLGRVRLVRGGDVAGLGVGADLNLLGFERGLL